MTAARGDVSEADAAGLLRALGRPVKGPSGPELEEQLAAAVCAAEEALRRSAARIEAGLASDGELWQGMGLPAPRYEGWPVDLGMRDEGWEADGPWGDSLVWLESQQSEPAERCPRCNPPGPPRWSRGIDPAVLTAAPGQPQDHLAGLGDRRCVECGGCGYLVPERPRRPRAVPSEAEPELEAADVFDEQGYLRRPSYEESPGRREVGGASSIDVVAVSDGSIGEGWADLEAVWRDGSGGVAPYHCLAEEGRRLRSLVLLVGRYLESGRLDGEAGRRWATRSALSIPSLEGLSPSEKEKYLQAVVPRGGGRPLPYRQEAFAEREKAIFDLYVLDYPLSAIAREFGLSETQISGLVLVRGARALVRALRAELMHRWASHGHSKQAIANACGVGERTVARVLNRPVPVVDPYGWGLFVSLFNLPSELAKWCFVALFNLAAPGGDLGAGGRQPFVSAPIDTPRTVGLGGAPYEPYHSWLPDENDLAAGRLAPEEFRRGALARLMPSIGLISRRTLKAVARIGAPATSRG